MMWLLKRIVITFILVIWFFIGICLTPVFIFDWVFIGEDWALLYIDLLIMVLSEF